MSPALCSALAAGAVAVTPTGKGKLNVAWADNSGNESGFLVERAPDVGGSPGTFTALTTTGLTDPVGAEYDTELAVLPTAVADVLERLGRVDHTHILDAAADAFRLAAGRPPTGSSAVKLSRWAPLARDLRLAARDLGHVARLTTSSNAAACE